MTTTHNLGITLVDEAQAQKEVTINQAFSCFDALIAGAVEDKDLATPPASPADSAVYIVAASPTGAWAGQANALAYYDQVWNFIAPQTGMRLWVRDESQYYQFNGTAWTLASMGGGSGAITPTSVTTTGTITAGNYYLGAQGTMISTSLATSFPSYVWPMIWLTTNDDYLGGVGHPVCSITLENTSTTNRFGEIAFAKRVSGIPTDTWAFSVDPDRVNTENFRLRHTGQTLVDWSADNAVMRVFSNFVIDGSVGKAIQSRNAADTASVNLVRMAGGDYMQCGQSSSNLTGIQFYPGAAGLAAQIDGSTALIKLNPGANGRTLVGSVTDDGSTALQASSLVAGSVGAKQTSGAVTMKIDKGNSGDLGRFEFRTGGINMFNIGTGIYTTDDSNLDIGTDSASVMRFNMAGRAMIGTTSDDGQNKLQVNGNVGIGVTTATASAALEVKSTTQGVLFPRMTTTQKNAISSPAEGLVVYDTTLHKLCVRTASAWETITSV